MDQTPTPSPGSTLLDSRDPRLPHELVIEIFRDTLLDDRDLYQCALVSRRYLKDVREILYEELQVTLHENEDKPVPAGEQETRGEMKYTKEAFALLKTLIDHPSLARLVRVISFDTFRHSKIDGVQGSSPLVTTQLNTVSTFLGLVGGVRGIRFGRLWKDSDDQINTLASHPELRELSLDTLSPRTFNRIPSRFPNIECLEVGEFARDGWGAMSSKRATRLKSISLRGTGRTVGTCLVLTSTTTLRKLKVTATVASNLDFSRFPHLLDLVVYRPSLLYDCCDKFWRSLCTSPSLATLSFEFPKSAVPIHEGLFTFPPGDTSDYPFTAIPTLKTIRFLGHVCLDRVQFVLAGPLASTLARIVIPASFSGPDTLYYKGNAVRYTAILAMCKQTGVELYLADDC